MIKRGAAVDGNYDVVKEINCTTLVNGPVIFDNTDGTTNELEFQAGGRHARRDIVVKVCAWKEFWSI